MGILKYPLTIMIFAGLCLPNIKKSRNLKFYLLFSFFIGFTKLLMAILEMIFIINAFMKGVDFAIVSRMLFLNIVQNSILFKFVMTAIRRKKLLGLLKMLTEDPFKSVDNEEVKIENESESFIRFVK